MIGAISTWGLEMATIQRGAFKWPQANEWMKDLAEAIEARGVPLPSVTIVSDNAPAHSRFEIVAQEMGFTLLRLGPYSPMLNPIENVWSVVKARVKRLNRVPITNGPGVIEQRLVHIEQLMRDSISEITPYLCSQNINHASRFYRRALALEDMLVGT